MIKINLLPIHILQRRRVRALFKVFAALLVAEILLLVLYCWAPVPWSLTGRIKKLTGDNEVAKRAEEEVHQIERERDAERGKAVEPKAWVDWYDNSQLANKRWPTIFRYINRYIPDNVVIQEFPVTPGKRVYTFTGATDNPASVVKFYFNLLRCPNFSNVQYALSPSFTGFPEGEGGGMQPAGGAGGGTAALLAGLPPGVTMSQLAALGGGALPPGVNMSQLAALAGGGGMPGGLGGMGGFSGQGIQGLPPLPKHRQQFQISFTVSDAVTIGIPGPPAGVGATGGAAGLAGLAGLAGMPGGVGLAGMPGAGGMMPPP